MIGCAHFGVLSNRNPKSQYSSQYMYISSPKTKIPNWARSGSFIYWE